MYKKIQTDLGSFLFNQLKKTSVNVEELLTKILLNVFQKLLILIEFNVSVELNDFS